MYLLQMFYFTCNHGPTQVLRLLFNATIRNECRNPDNFMVCSNNDVSIQQFIQKSMRHVYLLCQFTSVAGERQLKCSR